MTQQYCCVMIPDLVDLGQPAVWRVLPPGIHLATMREIGERFAVNPDRIRLFEGFVRVVSALRLAGCSTVYLDGSFTTDKPCPNDYDGCWDLTGVDPHKLDPVLLQYDNSRAAQKAKYFGEMFIANLPASPSEIYLEFFQTEKDTGKKKGILKIEIQSQVNP